MGQLICLRKPVKPFFFLNQFRIDQNLGNFIEIAGWNIVYAKFGAQKNRLYCQLTVKIKSIITYH